MCARLGSLLDLARAWHDRTTATVRRAQHYEPGPNGNVRTMVDRSARSADPVERRRPAPISGVRAMDARSDAPCSGLLSPCRARVSRRPGGSPPSTHRDPEPEQQREPHTHDQPERHTVAEKCERPSEHGCDEHESRYCRHEAAAVVPKCRLGPQLTFHNPASCPTEPHKAADQAPRDNQLQRSINDPGDDLGGLGCWSTEPPHP